MYIPFNLRQLQYFHGAATTGSLAAAAEQMHVTHTALALALQEFEKRLGLTLMLRRKGRGIILTGEGQRILEKSQALLADAVHCWMRRRILARTYRVVFGSGYFRRWPH